jgi:hypothetical protein
MGIPAFIFCKEVINNPYGTTSPNVITKYLAYTVSLCLAPATSGSQEPPIQL